MLIPFKNIFIAGHQGMVGSAVLKLLANRFPTITPILRTRQELNLCSSGDVEAFFQETKPDAVIFAAAKVGGILANSTYPVEFLSENIQMATNALGAAARANVKRFLYLGSTCIYPKHAPQPMVESSLLSSPLEPTNEAYALAKIVGLKLCQYYRKEYGLNYHSAMPTNLYGPGDNYHPDHSHVIPGLLRRFHQAKIDQAPSVSLWGSGTPRREFLFVDDLAQALLHLLSLESPPDWVNIGTGKDVSILELAHLVAKTIGYQGQITLDPSKPDGTPLKRTDPSLINSTGWQSETPLELGLQKTLQDFLSRKDQGILRSK